MPVASRDSGQGLPRSEGASHRRPVEPVKHYYSSKPALLPTLIAGILYPARVATGVPLDRVVLQARARAGRKSRTRRRRTGSRACSKRPKNPVRWPVYIFYFKPIVVLSMSSRLECFWCSTLGCWTAMRPTTGPGFSRLVAAAFGTYLLPFTQTLNNHTIAALSVFFAVYQLFWIWDETIALRLAVRGRRFLRGIRRGQRVARPGVPAAVVRLLLVRFPGKTLVFFVPARARSDRRVRWPLSMRSSASSSWRTSRSAPTSISTKEVSGRRRWTSTLSTTTPSRMPTYFFHMTLGHHGFFSLTPIFLLLGVGRGPTDQGRRLVGLPRRADGDGGTGLADDGADHHPAGVLHLEPQGAELRRLDPGTALAVLDDPVLAALLPKGVESGQTRHWVRPLALLALGVSVMSVGYAIRNPWTHPWILDALQHLNLYPLTR